MSPSLLELNQLIYLNLSRNAMEGILPSSIGSLQKLKFLDLASTNINGMIPPQLGNLSNLEYLNLGGVNPWRESYNQLWASDLNWLSYLTSLEYLNLGGVDLSKASTHWLEAISLLPTLFELHLENCNLEYPPLSIIDLSYNELIWEVSPWLFNITILVQLDLSLCKIMDPISNLSWHNLNNLEVLNLEHNSISDDIGPLIHVLPPFLFELHLENCNLHYSHLVSLSIANHKSLSIVDLSVNNLISEIPPLLFNITTLVSLDLSSCNITGPISHLPWHNLCNLEVLNLGDNSISDDIGNFVDVLSERSNNSLHSLTLCQNFLRGQLVESLGRLISLTSLALYQSLISGKIPSSIGRLLFLEELNLYSNKMSGSIPISVGDLSSLIHLDLSDNYWKGKLSEAHFHKLSKLKNLRIISSNKALVFDLAHDWFSHFSLHIILISDCLLGPAFPPWIQKQKELTEIIQLNEQVSETIPDWFWNLSTPQNNLIRQLFDNWDTFRNLHYLVLSKNNLSGEIPMSICSLPCLFWLDLTHNSFNGRLPSSLQNCSTLKGLNLRGNRLSGNIPRWSGKSLPNIGLIKLQMNKLVEKIPQELCHLPDLHALNLSHNNLSGMIPTCFSNLSCLMVSVKHRIYLVDEVMDFVLKGRFTEYAKILDILNIIDLSNNNLIGQIPEEIANLISLGTLKFSRNQLSGKIPEKIGQLKKLETLDLSHNHLSGSIPASMSSLTSLNYLDLMFNNFSGSIPSSTQPSTFNNNIYEGNLGLYGSPLPNPCYTSVAKDSNKDKNEKGKGRNKDKDEMFWFYVSIGPGFIVGFWGLFGSLAIKRT